MKKAEYFSQLISLYEDASASQEEEPISENAADEELPNDENDAISEDDPNSSMPLNQNEPQTTDASLVMEKQKFVKLFELYEDLLNYGEAFIDSTTMIDINLLEIEILKKTIAYINNIKKLVEKIENYLINVYSSADYSKDLYSYVLFRTELVQNIKGFRDILKLKQSDIGSAEK